MCICEDENDEVVVDCDGGGGLVVDVLIDDCEFGCEWVGVDVVVCEVGE